MNAAQQHVAKDCESIVMRSCPSDRPSSFVLRPVQRAPRIYFYPTEKNQASRPPSRFSNSSGDRRRPALSSFNYIHMTPRRIDIGINSRSGRTPVQCPRTFKKAAATTPARILGPTQKPLAPLPPATGSNPESRFPVLKKPMVSGGHAVPGRARGELYTQNLKRFKNFNNGALKLKLKIK